MTEGLFEGVDGLRESLQADGYDLRIQDLGAGRLRATVLALEGACEECLVPKDVMRHMLLRQLKNAGAQEIELHYPGEE